MTRLSCCRRAQGQEGAEGRRAQGQEGEEGEGEEGPSKRRGEGQEAAFSLQQLHEDPARKAQDRGPVSQPQRGLQGRGAYVEAALKRGAAGVQAS